MGVAMEYGPEEKLAEAVAERACLIGVAVALRKKVAELEAELEVAELRLAGVHEADIALFAEELPF